MESAMKKYFLACSLILFITFSITFGAIITVENKHPYAGQYRTLQEAHDAASAGDSLYISPSQIKYGGINVTKPISIIGIGYDVTAISGGAYTLTAIISDMTFNTGADGALLEGLDGAFRVVINNTANITIRRNKLNSLDITNSFGCTIVQNEIISNGYYPLSFSASSNILINNNIFIQPSGVSNPPAIGPGGTDLLILNNIIKNQQGPTIWVSDSQLINNVIISSLFDPVIIAGTNNSIRYNIFNSNWPATWGNHSNVDPSTIFIDYANNNYHLRPDSPALASGENGVDIGIYGGDAPYIDGGFPSLPSILQLKGDLVAAPGTGLNIEFKAKSNR